MPWAAPALHRDTCSAQKGSKRQCQQDANELFWLKRASLALPRLYTQITVSRATEQKQPKVTQLRRGTELAPGEGLACLGCKSKAIGNHVPVLARMNELRDPLSLARQILKALQMEC